MVNKERIGIFGGTFDPPHIGHQILAMEAYDELRLNRLFWVLSPEPPHKKGKDIAPTERRIDMVKAAIGDDEMFSFSSIDLDRPGPHYVVDTIKIFRENFPGSTLVFIMGGDSLRDLATWYKPHEFIDECDELGVMHRPGEKIDIEDLRREFPKIAQKIHFIEAPLLEVSSNKIRELIYQNKPFRYYLPEKVFVIIMENHLYSNIN